MLTFQEGVSSRGPYVLTFQEGVSSQGTLCAYCPGGGEFPGDLMCLPSRRG